MGWGSAKLSEIRRRVPQRAVVGLKPLWEEVQRAPVHGKVGRTLHHVQQALRSIFAAPVNSLLTILSSALALVLFGLFLMCLDNVHDALRAQRAGVSLSVFLERTLVESERENLSRALKALPGVTAIEYVTPEEAFARLRTTLGENAGALDGIDPSNVALNPLPASFEVTFERDTSADLENIAAQFEHKNGVETVLFDRGFFAYVTELLQSLSRAAWFGIPFLFLMVAFIIASTVRLSLHAHRDEIQIMRLVGARHRYVRTPFLIAAVIQGTLGALVAAGALIAIRAVAHRALAHTSGMQLLLPTELTLAWWVIALVLLAGVLTGLCASAITLRRFSVDV